MTRQEYLYRLAGHRVLVLDGAMGTMLQQACPDAGDFALYPLVEDAALDARAVGCNELLCINRPDLIYDIHMAYLQAGADIVETNTFCANAFSLAEYGLVDHVYDLNLAACEIARQAVETIEETEESRYAFVAGVMGPTSRGLSFSSSVEDPAFRQSDFSQFKAMYMEQAKALVEGGVDLILIETVFDTLAAKAALAACRQVFRELDKELPVMVSVTFSDRSGRTLSGQDLEAFVISLSHEKLFALGMNCSTGAAEMVPLIRRLGACSPFRVSAHPNAGFPDREGRYEQTPRQMGGALSSVLRDGALNIVGGCCGTTPAHIAEIASLAKTARVREVPRLPMALRLSGLDSLVASPGHRMLVIGERTNVAGSKKFARLISQGKWDEALSVARLQVEQGAQIIDVCMDASLIDAPQAMVTFLRYVASDPAVSRVPIMVDSSDWAVVEAALGELQGRGIVNSISLKEGPEKFLSRARQVAEAGCAMVVMLFDESGQADVLARKIEVAKRSYELLTENGIPASSVIMDPNVLAIATGINEHDGYALDFIEAVRWIKTNLPGVSVSGGVSNLSFSFRGNNRLREAMHTVFLHHACKAGLDMAIVNPATDCAYEQIPAHALAVIEEALLLTGGNGPAAREALIQLAVSDELSDVASSASPMADAWRSLPVADRIVEAVVRGDDSYLQEDLDLLLSETSTAGGSPVAIVEGPLMSGMGKVGGLFGEGKLFLPQVVRSARTMKHAVDILQPHISAYLQRQNQETGYQTAQKIGTIVMATVKGDVHDIGKNIVDLVLACNNFDVVDLGVMVPPERILEAALEHDADIVGLSGLITPSLAEMAVVCRMFQERGLRVPVMVGGATTSELHTALKLAPLYDGPVLQTADASAMASAALKIVSAEPQRTIFLEQMAMRYRQIVAEDAKEDRTQDIVRYPRSKILGRRLSYEEAFARRYIKEIPSVYPSCFGIRVFDDISFDDLFPLVNWDMLAVGWKVPVHSSEAERLIDDAKRLVEDIGCRKALANGIRSVAGLFAAKSDGLAVTLALPSTTKGDGSSCPFLKTDFIPIGELHFLRRQTVVDGRPSLSLADYIAPAGAQGEYQDAAALFVVTSGLGLAPEVERLKAKNDGYRAILLQMVADRLAEACAEVTNERICRWWGLSGSGGGMVRPAPGYPTWPDHSEKATIFRMLDATARIGVELTDHFAMSPAASVCGCVMAGGDLRYFSVGEVGEDQMKIYADRKNCMPENLATVIQGME